MTGHGVQKLFGWFGGPGPEGTAGYVESLGLRPGKLWGQSAGLAEAGGGLLTSLGLLHPIGPLGVISSMTMASATQHANKPIWSTAGGAELPVTNIAACLALMLTGPGRFSMDRLFGLRLPTAGVALLAAFMAAAVMQGLQSGKAEEERAADREMTSFQTPISP